MSRPVRRALITATFLTLTLGVTGCGNPFTVPAQEPLGPVLSEADAAAIVGAYGLLKQTPADDASGQVTAFTAALETTKTKPDNPTLDLGVQGNQLSEFEVQQTGMPWPACYSVTNTILTGVHRNWVIYFDPPLFGRANQELGSLVLIRDNIRTCAEARDAATAFVSKKDRDAATKESEKYLKSAFIYLPPDQVTPYGQELLDWAITGENAPGTDNTSAVPSPSDPGAPTQSPKPTKSPTPSPEATKTPKPSPTPMKTPSSTATATPEPSGSTSPTGTPSPTTTP